MMYRYNRSNRGPLRFPQPWEFADRYYYRRQSRYTGKQIRARGWAVAIACERHPERNPRSWF